MKFCALFNNYEKISSPYVSINKREVKFEQKYYFRKLFNMRFFEEKINIE